MFEGKNQTLKSNLKLKYATQNKTQVLYLRKSQGQDPRKDKNPEGLLREVTFSDPLRMLRLQMGIIKKY